MGSYVIILSLAVCLFFTTNSAFADVSITTADNDLAVPGCLETQVGCYTPNIAIVNVGETVIMTNTDVAGIHTFTSGTVDGFTPSPDGIFDSGMLMKPGDSFEWTPNTSGDYPYYCTLHVWMQGTIIVQEAESLPPTISISTNRASYGNGDTVVISGNIKNYDPSSGQGLTFLITSPDNNIVTLGKLTPNSDGSFEKTFVAGGPLWKSSGDYIVAFHYGSTTGEAIIVYTGGDAQAPPIYPSPAPYGTDVTMGAGSGAPGCEESDSCYIPSRITVDEGSSVTWYNSDSAAHTVTSGTPGGGPSGVFDSGMFMPGESFSHKFNNDGMYPYFCMVHPWMEGQIVVTGGSSPFNDTTPPKILKPTDITVDSENGNGARVSYDVLAIDETDQIVRASCSPSSGSVFGIGETRVICNARDSAGNRAAPVSFYVTVNPPDVAIPDWIKNVASFWCEDKIDDASFIEGIQYLIDNNIIIVSASSGSGSTQEIPNWVKNNACWWSQGLITSNDFASGIEYLVSAGIIRV